MDMNVVFKGIVDDLDSEICFCAPDHTITYMNKKSIEKYSDRGGEKLIGRSLLECHNSSSKKLIEKYVDMLTKDENLHEINEGYNPKGNETNFIIAVRDSGKKLIGYYERHDRT